MKTNLILLGIFCFCLPFGHSFAGGSCGGNDACAEQASCPSPEYGPCVAYCQVTRYKPKYYCEKHCVQEPYTVQKKCCRYVPEYYTKQYCRYVPEYYTKTFCRQVPEYYCVDETKYRTKVISEQKCRYVPYTCVEKRNLGCLPPEQSACATPCASQQSASNSGDMYPVYEQNYSQAPYRSYSLSNDNRE